MRTLFSVLLFFLSACGQENINIDHRVHSLSISSDAHYVITGHGDNRLYLWDIKKRRVKEIAEHININSVYFIKGKDEFIWQDTIANRVFHYHIHDDSQTSFSPGFRVYGHVLSSKGEHYYASDKEFNIYHFFQGRKSIIKPADNSPNFSGIGKWLDLTLSTDETLLLSAGVGNAELDATLMSNIREELVEDRGLPMKYSHWAGVMLWQATSGRAFHQLGGNIDKTHATISPDGKYVVAGDENSRAYVWSSRSGKRLFELDNLYYGKDLGVCRDGTHCRWDATGLLIPPDDFCDQRGYGKCFQHERVNVMKFINSQSYLRFTEGIPYAILYAVSDPRPKQYFRLAGKDPDVYGFSGGMRTDTAPGANVLVMASNSNSGILVYQYNKTSQQLSLILSFHDFQQWTTDKH